LKLFGKVFRQLLVGISRDIFIDLIHDKVDRGGPGKLDSVLSDNLA
jgi:hypothetical protein